MKPVRLGQVTEGVPRASWSHDHKLSSERLRADLIKIKDLMEIQLKVQKQELQRYQSAMSSFKK